MRQFLTVAKKRLLRHPVAKTPTVIQCIYGSQKITLDVHSQPSKESYKESKQWVSKENQTVGVQGESTQQTLINHFIPIGAID